MRKIAIIGCGRISGNHIKAIINNQKNAKLVALCDTVIERAQDKSDEYYKTAVRGNDNLKLYSDYKKMLVEMPEIDIVSICTESGFHCEIALYCMNMKKHVIVEKPMALSIKDADEMIRVSNINNVKLCISHQNRFNPPIQKLRNAIEEGRFGKLIAGNARILWNRNQNYYDQAPWRGTYELDGGCLMNQCIHNIDLLQWMLGGEIDWVHGTVGNYTHSYIEAEDYGTSQIKFSNGAIGSIEGTVCVYPKNWEETLTIIGEKGFASIGGLAVNKIEAWRFEDELKSEDDILAEFSCQINNVYGEGHTPLYKDFTDAINVNRKPYIDGNDGKKALEIILMTYQSNHEGKRIYHPAPEIASLNFKR